jgi:hypothetical protein
VRTAMRSPGLVIPRPAQTNEESRPRRASMSSSKESRLARIPAAFLLRRNAEHAQAKWCAPAWSPQDRE